MAYEGTDKAKWVTPPGYAPWLAQFGAQMVGAEIGVAECGNVEAMLGHEGLIKALFAVDPWQEYPHDEYADPENRSQAEQDERYNKAQRTAKEDSRLIVMRMTSLEAVRYIADNSLDFVFIDGHHGLEYVAEDVRRWWPKVRAGGWCTGHDWYQVKEVVLPFFAQRELKIGIGIPDGDPVVWMVEKPAAQIDGSGELAPLNSGGALCIS